jgi:hypothetical protein
VAQNIVLVISSILRLELYVGIYALTYWRVAAFVWMGLVAAGLALIIARIALGKSNEWLLSANLLTLSATLYACSFINFAALIANYNVEHSFEMTGHGTELDFWYLRSLGPSARPALDRFLEQQARTNAASFSPTANSPVCWDRTRPATARPRKTGAPGAFATGGSFALSTRLSRSWFLRAPNPSCRAADPCHITS